MQANRDFWPYGWRHKRAASPTLEERSIFLQSACAFILEWAFIRFIIASLANIYSSRHDWKDVVLSVCWWTSCSLYVFPFNWKIRNISFQLACIVLRDASHCILNTMSVPPKEEIVLYDQVRNLYWQVVTNFIAFENFTIAYLDTEGRDILDCQLKFGQVNTFLCHCALIY